jgi:biotin synthase
MLNYLYRQAREVAQAHFGRRIYIRGLIEITNRCRNNCLYCGIRKGNTHVHRYTLTNEQILSSCREGHRLGFRTFVLQGGELSDSDTLPLLHTVAAIRREYPDSAITLSLGEHSRTVYEQLYQAGANRYLLRHETHNTSHYARLHPAEKSSAHRLQCLQWLKEIGYQTGTGIMVGTPEQTVDHLLEDIAYIETFRPQMIGIGPFIPHHDTPLGHEPAGSITLTLKLLAIFRLMHPAVLLPATTALATLSPDGREQGILAGANVVMPNLSPCDRRADSNLYDNKATLGAEAAEGLELLKQNLTAIGYELSYEKGDYV